MAHPSEGKSSGYNEIQHPKRRYAIIDYERLNGLFGPASAAQFTAAHKKWVEEALRDARFPRLTHYRPMCEKTMNVSIEYGTEQIDWAALCEIFRLAPLGTREPDKLKIAAENSFAVCTALVDGRMVGFGRAISDGQYQSAIYDVVVLPEFQNQGVGKTIMNALIEKLPKKSTVLIFVAPGKQDFYRKFGFGNLKTGMGLFPNPEMSRAKGYLE